MSIQASRPHTLWTYLRPHCQATPGGGTSSRAGSDAPSRAGERSTARVDVTGASTELPMVPTDTLAVPECTSASPTSPLSASLTTAARSSGVQEEVVDLHGNRTTVYGRGADGQIVTTPSEPKPGLSKGFLEFARQVFVPRHVETSVSSDYLPTRGLTFLRDIAFNVGNFATGSALALAMGMNPVWGGAAMATFNLIRDRVCQTAGFAFSFATPMADRNPRPWIATSEAVDTAGMVLESTVAMVPGLLLPVELAAATVRVFGGCMRGAAMANIDPRQAVGDNLGEMRAKNGNQGYVSSLLGSLAGMGLMHAATPLLGPLAAPVIATASAGLSCLAMAAMVRRLDLHPVNEKAVQTVVRSLAEDGAVPSPDRKGVWKAVAGLARGDRIEMGREIRGLLDDAARFDELRHIYRGRNYLLEAREGRPYVVLRDGCEPADRFQAAVQAVHVERLQDTTEYQDRLEQGGTKAADQWLVAESLAATPPSVTPLLAEMKELGWSVDLLRFRDSGRRARWEGP